MDEPLITIAMPVHNAEAHLKNAIDSVLAQTYRNIELVLVDDCSTDSSAKIIDDAMREDRRVRSICHETNRRSFETRRTCVEQAMGEYFMFMDADDWIDGKVCEACMEALREAKYDIIHFSAVPVYSCEVPDEVRQTDTAYLTPSEGDAFGPDIVHRIYIDRAGPWAMWGKLYLTNVLRNAYQAIPPRKLFMADDAFMFFATAHFANSYLALPDIRGYFYRMDTGESGSDRVSQGRIEGLRRVCSTSSAIGALSDFLDSQDAWKLYKEDFLRLRRQFTDDSVGYLVTRIPPDNQAEALDVAMEYWENNEVLEAFLRRGEREAYEYLPAIRLSKAASFVDETRHGIGIMLDSGDVGTQDGIALLRLCEAAHLDALPIIDIGGIRHGLSRFAAITVTDPSLYHNRLRKLTQLIMDNDIGVLCVPTQDAYPYYWDALAGLLQGCIVMDTKSCFGKALPPELEESAQPAACALRACLAGRG